MNETPRLSILKKLLQKLHAERVSTTQAAEHCAAVGFDHVTAAGVFMVYESLDNLEASLRRLATPDEATDR
ncbi:MAG: hypothetical protein CMJ48_01390 [Planctomycetaceae bacterium]|nr:hypothetical protein [Planctomycetaceae bacterium]